MKNTTPPHPPFPRSALGIERNMFWYGFWSKLGRMLYWLSWPGIMLIVRNSPPRTRVFVEYKGQFLMVTDWLGDGTWKLPGGGLHQGEDPKQGAVRELAEETGVIVATKDLRKLAEFSPKTDAVSAEIIVFSVVLNKQPTLKKQNYEILDISWVDKKRLHQLPVSATTKTVLSALKNV